MPEYKDLAPFKPDGSERNLARRYPVVPLEGDSSEISSYLHTYWHILLKRRWTILAITFVVTTLVTIFAFKTKPVYQAVSRVAVEAETPQFQTVQNLNQIQPTDSAYLETQVGVLGSEDLAWKTIQQLHLDKNPEFVLSSSKTTENQDKPDAGETHLVHLFKGALSVQLLNGTRIIEVAFESPDPTLAARVVNALVRNYTEYNFLTKYDATRQASAWMEQRLDELKARVEKSQQALVDYERENSIVDIGDRESVLEQRLGNLSKDLTEAQNDLAQKQSLYQLAEANPKQVGVLVQDTLLEQLQGKYGDLETQYVNTLAQYGPNFPTVVRLRDQVKEVRSLMEQGRKQVFERVRHDYLATLGREKILAAAVDHEKAEIGKANQLLIQQNILKHEFQTNQDLYDSLLRQVKNAMVSAGMHANNVHVIDHALVPTAPVRPMKALDLAVGLVVGLMLGITVAFVQEGLDTSVKNAEDVEKLVPVPTLAVIPVALSLNQQRSWLRRNEHQAKTQDHAVALAVSRQPHSALAESFRSLCTSILLSSAPRPPQTLLVTSIQPGEGKTSTSINLALALAQRGRRVLLIDCDLRKPKVGRTLGLVGAKGLSGFLTGAHGLDEAIEQPALYPNLWALAAGPHPPNPAELLSTPTMEHLLRELRNRFDHVVVDSPPALLVTDATILSMFVDGVVLVVESGVTPRNAVLRSYKLLEISGARILGTVINKMDYRHDGYYGYVYKSYYHSYYGEGEPSDPVSDDVSAEVPEPNSIPKS